MKVCLFNYRKFQLDLQLDWARKFSLNPPYAAAFPMGG